MLMTQPLQCGTLALYSLFTAFFFLMSKVLGLGFVAVSLRNEDSAVYW